MKNAGIKESTTASQMITDQIAELGDWRGEVYARLRQLVVEAVPDITEEWKWGTAVWSKKGLVCSVAAFKGHVKLQFFKGASLPDPHNLFVSNSDAKAMRAIDFTESSKLDEATVKDLIRIAVAYNESGG